jgi:hypothetical protein
MNSVFYTSFYVTGLIVIALLFAGILAGCSNFSFRIGEVSWEGNPEPLYIGEGDGLAPLK